VQVVGDAEGVGDRGEVLAADLGLPDSQRSYLP
jgi:hypothetical protein